MPCPGTPECLQASPGGFQKKRPWLPSGWIHFGIDIVASDGDIVVLSLWSGFASAYLHHFRLDAPNPEQSLNSLDLHDDDGRDFIYPRLSISRGSLLVGMPDHDVDGPQAGMAFVYALRPHFDLRAVLRSPLKDPSHEYFGRAVALRGNRAVVAAPHWLGLDRPPAAYGFELPPGGGPADLVFTVWGPGGNTATNTDFFGAALSLNEHFLAVGAPYADQGFVDQGVVLVYGLHGGAPHPTPGRIFLPHATAEDRAGFYLASSHDLLVVGSPDNDHLAENSGMVALFSTNGPRLLFQPQAGASARLSWMPLWRGYRIQSKSGLAGEAWIDLPGGDTNPQVILLEHPMSLFRLGKPGAGD